MRIRLHVDRIVLEGLDLTADEARRFEPALRAELARLLAQRDAGGSTPWLGGSSGARPSSSAAPVTVLVARPARATAVAAAVAGAIVGGLES